MVGRAALSELTDIEMRHSREARGAFETRQALDDGMAHGAAAREARPECPRARSRVGYSGEVPKRSNGTDCKSVGICLRRFESCHSHNTYLTEGYEDVCDPVRS